MSNCDSPEVPLTKCSDLKSAHPDHAQNLSANLGNKENKEDLEEPPKIQSGHKKVNHRCSHNIGPPPRPFKKARYAWEIKNYDYTIKKMTQSINNNTETEDREKSASSHTEKDKCGAGRNVSQTCVSGTDALDTNVNVEDARNLKVQMGLHHQQGNFVGALLPTAYHAHYGAYIQNSLSNANCVNNVHAQIPPDPDGRLLRWHTRQLCQSIFDNTVNRMLENMGFSPMTERSQTLHPLLVLSLSDEEEREAEEAHQQALETQALSAALHQKGFLPHQYGYDNVESTNTSDYDSSEEDSDVGDTGHDDSTEHPVILPPSPQNGEELALYSRQSQHPSLQHVGDQPFSYPYSAINQLHQPTETCNHHCNSTQYHCDYQNFCRPHKVICNAKDQNSTSLIEGNLDSKLSQNAKDFSAEYIQMCLSHKCANEVQNEDNSSPNETQKVDNNENCIKRETLIEGKVEGVLDNHGSGIGLENNVNKTIEPASNNDSYFIRNSIHMAKQQGLGFQRA